MRELGNRLNKEQTRIAENAQVKTSLPKKQRGSVIFGRV